MRGKANLVRCLLCVLFLTWPVQAKYGGGSGTAEDPYLINTAEQMNAIGSNWNDWDKHFKLMADIDLSGYAGTDFNIIGIGTRNAFTGVFDGNGKKISNFNYASTNGGYKGLFRYVSGENAQIKDLGLIAPNIDAGAGSCVGSLIGYVSAGTITNCYAEGGSVSGKRWVGGLVGYNRGRIKDCYSACGVSGNKEVGGLVGYNSSGTITNCSASGDVLGSEDVGGLVGGSNGTINNSSATGSVAGDDRDVGGLVGYNTGPISNCSAGGDVLGSGHVGGLVGSSSALITDCYASGSVSGGDSVGGLVGSTGDLIANCYAIGSVSGTTDVGGLVGVVGDNR
ncbi:MAG: peptidase A26, partial [Desulfobacterales bacterium]|nr:peptidase A26 [Desulfobacterales bacterium]